MVDKKPSEQQEPVVSVICICYNHAPYVREALKSVLAQSYHHTEVIIADNGSTDNSADIIKEVLEEEGRDIRFIENKTNQGNCRAFNHCLSFATGKYIIDFATDDIMLPERIAEQVKFFEDLPEHYGVIYSDAENITKSGASLGTHYKRKKGKLQEAVPSGNLYNDILRKHFINPPTIMMKRSVLTELGGYDESLNYEDFDFWVRSSRYYHYGYQNMVLTKRRVTGEGLGSLAVRRHEQSGRSTLRICRKAAWLNRSEPENLALRVRLHYHMRQSLFWGNRSLVVAYYQLIREMGIPNLQSGVVYLLSFIELPLAPFYRSFLYLRQRTRKIS